MNAEPILVQPGASAQLRNARCFWRSHFSGDSMLPSGRNEHDGVLQGPSRIPRQGPEEALDGYPTSGWLTCRRCLGAHDRHLRVRPP